MTEQFGSPWRRVAFDDRSEPLFTSTGAGPTCTDERRPDLSGDQYDPTSPTVGGGCADAEAPRAPAGRAISRDDFLARCGRAIADAMPSAPPEEREDLTQELAIALARKHGWTPPASVVAPVSLNKHARSLARDLAEWRDVAPETRLETRHLLRARGYCAPRNRQRRGPRTRRRVACRGGGGRRATRAGPGDSDDGSEGEPAGLAPPRGRRRTTAGAPA